MTSRVRNRATVLAHHLYDFAECEHRIALDVTLDRERRTPPDEATRLMLEHGRRIEREIVEPLGYAEVEVGGGDWVAAFDRTLALMRDGVAGIDQGVLLDEGRLARPDLLERVPGRSALGDHRYRPGDVKSALRTRSDAVLQIGFAAILLERVQGWRPSTGFVLLGDGRRDEIDLEAIRHTIDDAVARAERIARGEAETSAHFSAACGRCRWRGACVLELQTRRDLSFVHGLTRTRCRVLARHGVRSIDDLAGADLDRLACEGVPIEGLGRAREQARALLEGRPRGAKRVPLPAGRASELYLRIDVDPLDRGEPFLIAWGSARTGGGSLARCDAIVASTSGERAEAMARALESLESAAVRDEPVYVFGPATLRALESWAESIDLSPGRVGDLAGRIVDLAPWVRRAAVLPVFRYRFDEVAAVARGLPRPSPATPDDALFVLHAAMGDGDDAALGNSLREAGASGIESLHAIRAWLGRLPGEFDA